LKKGGARVGVLIPNPQPLTNCPSRKICEQRNGQTYLVFIDETFLQVFERNVRGYFCHPAVGVPEAEYDAVRQEMQPIFQRYREMLVPELTEFKSTDFQRIPFVDRWDLAKRIHDVLYAHGGFISGFYPRANSYLLERVRVDLLEVDGIKAVPAEHKDLVEKKAKETVAAWTGPGMSDIIQQLLHTPVSGLLHFATGIDIRIKIVYDPREPKEDKVVAEAIKRVAGFTEKLQPDSAGRLLDVNITSKSEDEIGLQLADLAAGECGPSSKRIETCRNSAHPRI
jgi:hypothetical protein